MKHFILSLSLFIVITFSLTLGLCSFTQFLLKHKKTETLKTEENINIVFAGDSNIESAINDSLVTNSINIAQSGEAFLYSYIKLRSLLEYNNQIDTVFIGLSLHNLLSETEELWLFSDEYVIEKIKSYNYLLNNSEKYLIFTHNPMAYVKGLLKSVSDFFSISFRNFSSKSISKGISGFGGYEFLVRDELQEDIKLQERIKMNLSTELPINKGLLQERYLKMISLLCQQRSVKLIYINTPKYKYSQIPKYWFKYINVNKEDNTLLNSVLNQLPIDSLLDFSLLIQADSCFSDILHLNYKGAKIFSQFMNTKLHPSESSSSIMNN